MELPYVVTNIDFVSVPSVPLEYRGGRHLKHKRQKPQCDVSHETSSVTRRDTLHFPSSRQLTSSQTVVENDVLQSDFTIDRVTMFSLRPPELLFVRTLKQYFSWFVREVIPFREKKGNVFIKYLRQDVLSSHWIDAASDLIKLRPCAVTLFREFIISKGSLGTVDSNINDALMILDNLNNSTVHNNYVSSDPALSKFPAEVVFHNVLPMYPVQFLISVLLTLGEFDTEIDLHCVPTLKHVFIEANLLSDCVQGPPALKELMQKYVRHILSTTPGGTKSFDRLIVAANEAFNQLQSGYLLIDKLPSCLMTTLTQETEAAVLEFMTGKKLMIIQALSANTVPNLPNHTVLAAATIENPVYFPMTLQQSAEQSVA